MNSDYLIIGGGVIGLSIARGLHKGGAGKITIVERGEIGQEASWAAAGMLAPNAETGQIDDFYRFCSDSNALYPDLAAELLDEVGIDIELDRSGTLYLAFSEEDWAEIFARYKWQRDAGVAVESLSREEILKLEPYVSSHVQAGLFYPDDWQVENRKLIAALQRYAELNDIRLIENTPVAELAIRNGRVVGANSATGLLSADNVILAAGAWTSLLGRDNLKFPGEVKPIRGQMISFESTERQINRVIYSPRGYIVPRADGRILAGATVEDVGFVKEVMDAAVEELRSMAFEIAPMLAAFDIKDSWAGLRPMSSDGLPIIGPVPGIEGLTIATGHYRNGILLAPITAQIVAAELLTGERSEYTKIFRPGRFDNAAATAKN